MAMNKNSLRDRFRQMDAQRYQEIRDAYYKAVEGLQRLASALEAADAEETGPDINLLLAEHLLASQAIEIMNQSGLGKIL
ncbi:hypothetical protein NA78x_001742 [Anatilimnocola sp. NA78]|uniref:hypothetical protein n=1 Tax=Anatilimnocola sp. NA78 TaxID=3415683 RepID=UPI003CE54E95